MKVFFPSYAVRWNKYFHFAGSQFVTVLLVAACSSAPPKRPPCTWEMYAVEGAMVRGEKRVECPGTEGCVGLTKAGLKNLLTCGGE